MSSKMVQPYNNTDDEYMFKTNDCSWHKDGEMKFAILDLDFSLVTPGFLVKYCPFCGERIGGNN